MRWSRSSGGVGRRLGVDHARERERGLEERPAIETVEIGRGRFDAVVDFQRVTLVRGARQREAHARGAFADGQRGPIFAFGAGDEPVERGTALENGAHRQVDLGPDGGENQGSPAAAIKQAGRGNANGRNRRSMERGGSIEIERRNVTSK